MFWSIAAEIRHRSFSDVKDRNAIESYEIDVIALRNMAKALMKLQQRSDKSYHRQRLGKIPKAPL